MGGGLPSTNKLAFDYFLYSGTQFRGERVLAVVCPAMAMFPTPLR